MHRALWKSTIFLQIKLGQKWNRLDNTVKSNWGTKMWDFPQIGRRKNCLRGEWDLCFLCKLRGSGHPWGEGLPYNIVDYILFLFNFSVSSFDLTDIKIRIFGEYIQTHTPTKLLLIFCFLFSCTTNYIRCFWIFWCMPIVIAVATAHSFTLVGLNI